MSAPKLTYISRRIGPANIRSYGRVGPLGEQQKRAFHLAKNLGAVSVCSILPADYEHADAWHKVVEHQPGEILYAEAIVLRQPGQAVFFTSRDCPIAVFVDTSTGLVGMAHAGRPSLLGANMDCPSCNSGVLENLFIAMGNPYGENVLVYVTFGISAKNFPNKAEHVSPFLRKFGPEVVPEPDRNTLDLFMVIMKICEGRGVKKENIVSDGICTFDTEWTGSKRAGRKLSNWTFGMKTH